MRVLIFGCGYLGLRLARELRAAGTAVAAVTRSPVRAEEFRMRGFWPVVGNVLDAERLELPPTDVVVYAVGYDTTQKVSMREVYADGLRNVLAKVPGGARFLYVSSTGVYGQTDGDDVDETSETAPADEGGQAVLAAEQVLQAERPDALRLRFAGLYGPGRLLRRKSLEAGEPVPGDPEGYLNLIHVDDGIRAIRAAFDHGKPGSVVNVADDRPARRREFFSTLARSLKAPPPTFVPGPTGRNVNRRVQNERMKKELGVVLQYPTFVEGIAATRRSSL